MKVVFCSSYYETYLDAFYGKRKELSSQPYEVQLERIMKDYFGIYTSYVETFRNMGIDASLIIPNCKPLQKAWAKENNEPFNEKTWQFSIPLAQIKKAKPDIFYISSMFEYYGEFLDEAKKYAGRIFGWISCEIPAGIRLNQIELLFTSVPYFVEDFRKLGIRSEYIHAAFNPQILKVLNPPPTPDIDFSFIGSISPAHQNRIRFIKKLLDNTDLQFYGFGLSIPDERSFLKRLVSGHQYKNRSNGVVWGLDMFRTLQRSKITFNSHIDISKEYIGNMRMYEATGMGTLLLTDGKNAPAKNFNENEVVFYDSVDDAIDKVNYYLKHEAERAAIAKRGQERTLRDYTYHNSSSLMLEYFKKHM